MADQHVENTENSNGNLKKTKTKQTENSILDNFTKLKNSNDQIRIKASVDLLRYLVENKKHEKINDEMKYALQRLIRGLGSSNQQTRTGHFVVLVGLFNLQKTIEIDEIFQIINKELHKSGNNSKSENADVCMGQILVIGALIRSNSYQKLTDNDKLRLIELLLNAGKARDYLPLICYNFLCDLFKQIDYEEFEKISELVCGEVVKPWQNQNLNSLYLLQQISLNFPNVIKGKLLKNTLGTSQILCRESLPQLCTTLTNLSTINNLKHPIYDLFVQQLIGSDLIVDFCQELDKLLLKSNRNRYLIVTKLLTKILDNFNNFTLIPDLIQKNFLQQTINNFKIFYNVGNKTKDKEFHQIINTFLNLLLNKLKTNQIESTIKIDIIKKFLFYPGSFIFEKITRTRLIQNITLTLDCDGIKQLNRIYYDVILAKNDKIIGDNNKTEKWWNLDRIYATSLSIKLLNHPTMNDENDWKIEQLLFLMNLGLFYDEQHGNIGQELADSIKDTFYTALDLKLTKLDDLCYILNRIVVEIDQKIQENNLQKILRHPIELNDYKIWQKTYELIQKITKKHKKNNKHRVFLILFLHLNLQLFNNTKLATDSLNELFNCYQRIKNKKNDDNNETTTTTTDDPLWIEVVIDLFLNLLSHKSRLLRDIINCVFPYLCPYLTITTIQQIITAIDPKIDENPLSHDTSDDDDTDEDEEDHSDDDDEEESSEDDDQDEDVDDDETVNDKFRMALHQVLINNNDDDGDVDLDDLNDEDGAKLDNALSQIFKQFKPNSNNRKNNNKQTKSDELLTHFRIRVLDLIDIYLTTTTQQQPSLTILLELLLPLLEIYEFCIRDDHQKPLQDRCRACLKKLTTIKKFDNIEGVTTNTLIDLLNQLLDKGTKNSLIIQEMSDRIADCCIFLINCSQFLTTKKKKQQKIAQILRNHLELFFAKRDCLIPFLLFKNVLQLNWDGILLLIPLLYQVVYTETVRPYRRNQAIELLKIFYNNHRFLQNHPIVIVDDDIKQKQQQFLDDTLVFLEKFCNDPKSVRIREKFLSNLFNLLTIIKQSNYDCYNNWHKIANLIQQCRSIITISKDTRDNYRKLCRVLKINHIVAMKPDVVKLNHNNDNDDDDDDDDSGDNDDEHQQQQQETIKDKKRKYKLGKDALQMKKESKKLRLQSLSEGIVSSNKRKNLYNGDFGGDHQDDDDDDDSKKKSKIDD